MQKKDSTCGKKRRPIPARSRNPLELAARGIETTIIEGEDEPSYPYCALPHHFFERSLAIGTARGASISLESEGFPLKRARQG